MPSSNWPNRLATAFAILRGTMLVAVSLALVFVPEQALPGSATEPARSLGLMFASRTILLGGMLIGLAIARKREGLGWVLLVDAILQVFDTGILGGAGAKEVRRRSGWHRMIFAMSEIKPLPSTALGRYRDDVASTSVRRNNVETGCSSVTPAAP
jgi:hypothetical protein